MMMLIELIDQILEMFMIALMYQFSLYLVNISRCDGEECEGVANTTKF